MPPRGALECHSVLLWALLEEMFITVAVAAAAARRAIIGS